MGWSRSSRCVLVARFEAGLLGFNYADRDAAECRGSRERVHALLVGQVIETGPRVRGRDAKGAAPADAPPTTGAAHYAGGNAAGHPPRAFDAAHPASPPRPI